MQHYAPLKGAENNLEKKVAGLWDTNSLHHVLILSTSRAPDVVNRQKSKSQKKQSIDCY